MSTTTRAMVRGSTCLHTEGSLVTGLAHLAADMEHLIESKSESQSLHAVASAMSRCCCAVPSVSDENGSG